MKCFVVWSNEIKGRLDVGFYNPSLLALKSQKFKKINEVCLEIKNGSTPSGGKFEKNGIPYFRSQDFDLFDFKIKQYIGPGFHKSLSRSAIKPRDVLVAVVGATLGKIGYVPDDIAEGNINQNIAKLSVCDKAINPKFLAIFLYSNFGQQEIYRNATITTQAYLNSQQLGNIRVPLLPFEIQNKIVEIMDEAYSQKKEKEAEAENLLNSIDDYVLSKLGIKLPKLENKKCFVIWSDELKGNRIDPKAYLNIPRDILETISRTSFSLQKLRELIIKNISGEWGKDTDYKDENKEYVNLKVLRNTNFDNKFNLNTKNIADRLIPKTKIPKVILKHGDILIEKSGGSPVQPVGRVAFITQSEAGYSFSNFLQKISIKTEIIQPEYLFTYLKTLHRLNYMEYIQNQTTGIKNLIMEEFFSIPVIIPPLEIQNKIAGEVKNRMNKAQKLKTEAKEILSNAKKEVEKIILGE